MILISPIAHFKNLLFTAITAGIACAGLLAMAGPSKASMRSCQTLSEKGVHAAAIVACGQVADNASTRAATRAYALFYRANSNYSIREMKAASNDIDASLDLRADFGPALTLRAALRQQAGDFQGALTDLDRAVLLGTDGPDVRNARATARLATGDLVGAVDDLNALVARSPRDAVAQLRLAVTLNELGRNRPALQAADNAVALNRDNGNAFGIRAKIKSESGDLEGALEDYDRASSGTPNGGRYLIGKADLLLRAKRKREALDLIDLVLAKAPNDRTASLLKADILQQQGRFADARSALSAAAAKDPDLTLRRARLALAANDFASAALDYNVLIARAPQHWDAYFERGQVRVAAGEWQKAISDFDSAITGDPSLSDRRLHYLRGKAKYRVGDLEGAVADLSTDIARAESADALIWRALGLADLGEFDLAKADAGRLVALAPAEARSQAVLGDVLLKAGQISDGARAHKRALSIDPEYGPSKRRLEDLAPAN